MNYYLIRLLQAMVLTLLLAAVGWTEDSESANETNMEKTVVTATRTALSLKDAPGAITVITAEEIESMAANDVSDVIRQTAGISLAGRGVGGRTAVSIRGQESRQTLFLVDGKRVAASDAVFGHSDYETNWVPLASIERIEIVRGPLSALYGSEAMGGVVNIITRRSSDSWHGRASIGGGLRDDGNGGENQNYAAQIGGPIVGNKLNLGVSAEYTRDEDTPDPDDPASSELEGKEVMSIGSRLTYTPTVNHTFDADISFVNDDRWSDAVSRGTAYENIYELDKTMYSLGWQGALGPTQSALKAYRSDIDKHTIKNYTDGTSDDNPERLIEDVIDGQTSFSIGSNLLTVGGELRKETLESTSLVDGDADVTQQALFIQDELSLFGRRLLLTPGVRWDDHETYGDEVSPRLYALVKLSEQINFKAGYGHAFRAPTIKQVSDGYASASGPHLFIGNPDVKAEESDTYEAGIEYFGERIFFRVMGFLNDIEDLIEYERVEGGTGSMRTYKACNVAEAETRGVETELNLTFPRGWGASASYTYLDAYDTAADIRLDGKPRHIANAKLSYTHLRIGFSAALRYQFIGDQMLYNADDVLAAAPDYSLWHFSLKQRFLKHLEIQLGVENIGDIRLADKSDLFDYEERGRFYYANLRYEF